MKRVNETITRLQKHIKSFEFLNNSRVSKDNFKRNRVLDFVTMIYFMINFIRKSLVIEIDNFTQHFKENIKLQERSFGKSAYVQARKKIKPEAFIELTDVFIEDIYQNNPNIKLWNGFRLLSTDGSTVLVPKTKETIKYFGELKNQNKEGVVKARASVLYDVLNRYALTSEVSPYKIGERALANKHLDKIKPCSKDLFIYDRGYPSFEMFYRLSQESRSFLFRVREDYPPVKELLKGKKRTDIIEIKPSRKKSTANKEYDISSKITVRLVKVKLGNGKYEYLVTSLLDRKKYPNKLFKDLYFERWVVETYYDELKNKLKLEFFTGITTHTILQDFYTMIFVSNIQSMIVNELNDEINQETQGRKYKYKVNTNLSYGFMKNRILDLFFDDKSANTLNELKTLFKKNLVPIIPNRNEPRVINKYRKRLRPKVTKNHKDAI